MFLGFIATQNTDTHVLPMAEMNTFRRPPPGPDDCQVCRKPLPESRRYGRLCGYICTATAKHRRLTVETWKEWVAKDCVICNSPVPFERISRYPRTLTCGEVCGVGGRFYGKFELDGLREIIAADGGDKCGVQGGQMTNG